MVWFQVDDNLAWHQRVIDAGNRLYGPMGQGPAHGHPPTSSATADTEPSKPIPKTATIAHRPSTRDGKDGRWPCGVKTNAQPALRQRAPQTQGQGTSPQRRKRVRHLPATRQHGTPIPGPVGGGHRRDHPGQQARQPERPRELQARASPLQRQTRRRDAATTRRRPLRHRPTMVNPQVTPPPWAGAPFGSARRWPPTCAYYTRRSNAQTWQ